MSNPTILNELQAAIEFQVELSKFYNVDLFQRGYYQVRASLKTSAKTPLKLEVFLPKNTRASDLVFPASVINGVAVSKTFQILYKNEDVSINDVIHFKIQMLVDALRVEECITAADFHLEIQLWFTDEEMGPDQQEKLTMISERDIALHLTAAGGLHHHLPVLFDYFHLCVVCVTIHASVISLHQPYITIAGRSPARQAWSKDGTLEQVYFGNDAEHKPLPRNSPQRLAIACEVHRNICCHLLSAYESLQCSLQNLMLKLPPKQQIDIVLHDSRKHLNAIVDKVKGFDNVEDFMQTVQSDVAFLCGQNVVMWDQYLEVVTLNDKITHQLAKEHHLQRVKRFAEAFFTHEYPKHSAIACFDPSVHGHLEMGMVVKNSTYFQSLPRLAAECAEMDGDLLSTPIIFEDVFCEEAQPVKQFSSDTVLRRDRSRSCGSDASTLSDSSTSSPKFKRSSKLKFIKNIKPETFKRPSATLNSDQDVKGAVAGIREPDKCELVGYRKRDTNSFAPIMELGTLSPATTPSRTSLAGVAATAGSPSTLTSVSHGSLHNAASLPTLAGDSDLSLVSSGSMPELTRSNSFRRSPSDKEHKRRTSSRLEQQLVQARVENLDRKLREAEAVSLNDVQIQDVESSTSQAGAHSPPQLERILDDSKKFDDEEGGDEASNPVSTNTSDESVINESGAAEQTESKEDPTDNTELKDTTLTEEGISTSKEEEAVPNDAMSTEIPKNKEDMILEALNNEPQNIETLSNEVASNNDNTSSPASSSPLSQSHQSHSPEDSGVEIAINGIELEPELTNEEILQNLRESNEAHGEAAAAAGGEDTAGFRELSVDKPASEQHCTILEMLKDDFMNSLKEEEAAGEGAGRLGMARLEPLMQQKSEFSLNPQSGSPDRSHLLVSPVADETINFITAKENLRRNLKYTGHIYSDFPSQSSTVPYFWPADPGTEDNGVHLVVCVHGLDGNSADLRLVRTYLEMAMPSSRLDFLMSERNQPDTFADFEVMTERLIGEIKSHIDIYGMNPKRISFVGHSLGNLIIRSALGHPKMATLLPSLHTFLSLSGPHLGTLYNSSGLVNMGMWFMQKWKKSGSLLQLSLKDHSDPRQTFLYKLSTKPGLEYFRHILLVSSQQDRYVPYHSSRIELCKAATRDISGLGGVYAEMVNNILQPVLYKSDVELVRYDVVHALPNNATNNIIGRAAHIAVLDSEVFIEKLITVAGLKYFK